MTTLQERRVLAIDPTSRGFGFAVLEGPEKLIDWGVKQIRQEKKIRSVLQTCKLTKHYYPDIIVLEDWSGKGSRRCSRIGDLIREIRALAGNHHIPCRGFSRQKVRQAFAALHASTKYEIALAVAGQLPELMPRLPRFRKLWMSEDERMAIFDAAALALTYFHFASGRRGFAAIY